MTPADASEHRDEFCARLKHEREQRGVSLTHIANHTKIKASLLAALEHGDLSRWPKGIYRRAFFRDYVVAVGLPLDTYMAEFLRLFGERDETAAHDVPASIGSPKMPPSAVPAMALSMPPQVTATAPGLSFRLTFGDASGVRRSTARAAAASTATMRLATALTDVALVLALALGISWLNGRDIWQIAAIVAILDLAFTVFATKSPSALLFERLAMLGADRPLAASTPGTPTWATRLRALGPRLARMKHVTREYAERAVYSASMTTRSERRRDIMGMRRRRVEAANASVDEAGIV